MLFVAWLAVSFVVVAAVNLYLRYFGLPRRPLASTALDGRAYYDRAGLTSPAGATLGASAGGGGGWTASLFGSGHGSAAGETVRMYHTNWLLGLPSLWCQ